MLNLETIIEKIKDKKDLIFKNYNLIAIGIFGSYVRNEQERKSDIDILIDYDKRKGITLFDMVDLQMYLSDLLGVKVDLALKRSLKPAIGKHILKEVIYV